MSHFWVIRWKEMKEIIWSKLSRTTDSNWFLHARSQRKRFSRTLTPTIHKDLPFQQLKISLNWYHISKCLWYTTVLRLIAYNIKIEFWCNRKWRKRKMYIKTIHTSNRTRLMVEKPQLLSSLGNLEVNSTVHSFYNTH